MNTYYLYQWEMTHEALIRFSNVYNSTIVIFGGEEWELGLHHDNITWKVFKKIAKQNKLVVIQGCYNTKLTKINTLYPLKTTVVYWPEFWAYRSRTVMKDYICSHQDIKHLFLSLNNRPWKHRCQLIDLLAKHDMLNKGLWSFLKLPNPDAPETTYKFKYWKGVVTQIDNFNGYGNVISNGFSTSFVSLVAESTTKSHFITEKTWMCIYAEHPFLIVGPPHIHKFLKDTGIELYDEIFDYSFDSIEDDMTRFENIVKQVNNLGKQSLKDLRNLLLPKLIRNRKKAFEISDRAPPSIVMKYIKRNKSGFFKWIDWM